jgi:hypothetical protein
VLSLSVTVRLLVAFLRKRTSLERRVSRLNVQKPSKRDSNPSCKSVCSTDVQYLFFRHKWRCDVTVPQPFLHNVILYTPVTDHRPPRRPPSVQIQAVPTTAATYFLHTFPSQTPPNEPRPAFCPSPQPDLSIRCRLSFNSLGFRQQPNNVKNNI